MEYTHGLKFTHSVSFEWAELSNILDSEFPRWKYSNFYEDFSGQTMHTYPGAVVFRNPEDATQFYLKYGELFGMVPTSDIWYHIERM